LAANRMPVSSGLTALGTCIDTFPMLAANPRRCGRTILMFRALRAPVVPRLNMVRSM
jgi:hypothetical protein